MISINVDSNPITTDWRRHHAFGWPEGSVRAILALIIFSGIWGWLGLHPMTEVPSYLQNLMFIIMGTEIRVRMEDELLASRFGAQFDEYKASTPAYIPLVR